MVTSKQWGAVLSLGHDSQWLANGGLDIAGSIQTCLYELANYHINKYVPVTQISVFASGIIFCMLTLDQRWLEKLSIHRSACLTILSGYNMASHLLNPKR